ncbi:MAG TPA: polysaccharide deacetylase family protein [Flavihumibacter sp.]
MLSFRNSSIIVLILITLNIILGGPVGVYWLIGMAYFSLLVWGSMRIDSQFYTRAICRAPSKHETSKKIAISFDDGPMEEYTPQILDTLRQFNAPAVFFCIGQRVEANARLAKRIVEEGHIIGNHSYTHHALIDLYGTARLTRELADTNRAIEEATGKKPRYFRPPYGVTTPNLAKAIKNGAMTTIGWNLRSMDTVARSGEQLLEKLRKEVKPGAIVLLHDTMAVTASVLPRFIEALKEQGYEIVPIDQLINEEAYA